MRGARVVALLLACAGAAQAQQPPAGMGAPDATCPLGAAKLESWRAGFARIYGDWRSHRGLGPAARDAAVEAAAQDWAETLAATGSLTHTDLAGQGAGGRLTAAGLAWGLAAENLAKGDVAGPAGLLELWRRSQPHRANLAAFGVSRHGLGLACGADGLPVFVLDLADG